jgi:hypothetical protein
LESKRHQQQPKQQQQQQQKQQVLLRLTGKRAVLLDYCSEQQWQYCQSTACHSNCIFFTVQNVVTQDIVQLCPKHVRERLGDKWLNKQKEKIRHWLERLDDQFKQQSLNQQALKPRTKN